MDFPSGNAQFIAYAKAKEPMPGPGGTVIQGRSQVYVRYYDAIKIAEINIGGRNGVREGTEARTVAIKFDPASVNLTDPFSAYLDPDDALLPILQTAFEAGASVSVGIETVRKAKNSKTKESIPALTPIHALRGAKQDGSGGSMDASRDNIRNIVSLVDGTPGKRIVSDPSEWAELVNNKDGWLPPEGFRALIHPEKWELAGAIVPDGTAPRAQATQDNSAILIAIEKLRAEMSAQIEGLLSRLTDSSAVNPADTGSDIARRITKGAFSEGKPWDVRTSNGLLNLGGYQLSKQRAVFQEAHSILAAANRDADAESFVDDAEAWELAGLIMSITDQVQARTYGHDTPIDRTAPSHSEAGRWVSWAIAEAASNAEPYPADADARGPWAELITTIATEHFTTAANLVGEYLVARGARSQRPSAQAPAAPVEDATRSLPVLTALAAGVQSASKNADGLKNFGAQVNERGQSDVPFAFRIIDGNAEVKLAAALEEDAEGWNVGPAIKVIQHLYSLASNSQAAQAPQESVPAQAKPAITEPTKGYSIAAQAAIDTLSVATSTADVQAAYIAARDANVLDEQVGVRLTETGIEFGLYGQFTPQPLSIVLDKFRTDMKNRVIASEPDPSDDMGEEAEQEAPAHDPEPPMALATAPAATAAPATDARAQQIADQAAAAAASGDATTITSLISEANGAGLAEATISYRGQSGKLAYLLQKFQKDLAAMGKVPANA